MALNVGLGVTFDNIWDWKGMLEKAGEIKCTKTYITNYMRRPVEFTTGVALVNCKYVFSL
jgi:hypothetical protein